jgi:3-keto-disaccharide hydrolase
VESAVMQLRILARSALSAMVCLAMTAASYGGAAAAPAPAPAPVWRILFDGKILDTFRGWHSQGMPEGWHAVDGTLTKEGNVDDLVTKAEYGNFELELEWKIGEAGNSGVFYRATREYDQLYWSGPEYQLLDDVNAHDGRLRLTAAGSAYGIYPCPEGVVKPYGQWNTTRLIIKGDHVEHWLNGQKVVEYDLGSPDWKAKVAASKFSKYPNYGLAKRGLIGIQGDHPGALALRHIRIRELP